MENVTTYPKGICLSSKYRNVYYLFLWNPYKGVGKGSKSSTISDNNTVISTTELSELLTSPTVTTLLNSTAVLLSTALLKASGTKSMNVDFESVTPKSVSYKQKRSSERVSNFEEKLKTSFKPFYIPNRIRSSEELKKNNLIFVSSISNGDEERIIKPNILCFT